MKTMQGAGDVEQAVEHLPNKHKALCSKPQYLQKNKEKKRSSEKEQEKEGEREREREKKKEKEKKKY
jgi:hypothetical protein